MKKIMLSWTASALGAATVVSNTAVLGALYAVEYRPAATTNATIVLTCEADASKPLLTKATAGAAVVWFYPRDLVHEITDGSALVGAAGGDRSLPVMNGYPKVVITSGGNALSGSVILFYEDGS